ncbi:winged helix-turn-helix transcriptional regulator [Nocardioides phosphati]|nr:helix-turn-helix domain-containing protein [Nocardioides phosphati]
MAAFDLLGRRWMLRIIGELGEGPLGFNEAQRRLDGVSSSVLATRLRELAAVGLAETDATGAYRLTHVGTSLLVALAPLWAWSDEWATATGAEPNPAPSTALTEAITRPTASLP